jgi:hypothetical protein
MLGRCRAYDLLEEAMMRGLAALVVFAACAWTVPSASAETGDRVLGPSICGSATEYTILFWPHGHRPIGRDDLPEVIPHPHLEIYSGGHKTSYSSTDFVGSALASEVGRGAGESLIPSCEAFAQKGSVAFHGKSSTTHATALVCRFRSPPLHEVVSLVNDDVTPSLFGVGYLLIQRPNFRVVYARLWLNRSSLSYDSSFCHPTVPPR